MTPTRPLRVLGVCGSLREASTNGRLLRAAARLVPPGVEMRVSDSPGCLPLFNPDVAAEDSAIVAAWVDEMRAADGVVVSTPEYARGYPGALKNAFDWLVATDAHVDKPFMMLNATARSTIARDTLAVVLQTMSGIHVEAASTTIALLGTDLGIDDIVGNAEFRERIQTALVVFKAALTAQPLDGPSEQDIARPT